MFGEISIKYAHRHRFCMQQPSYPWSDIAEGLCIEIFIPGKHVKHWQALARSLADEPSFKWPCPADPADVLSVQTRPT